MNVFEREREDVSVFEREREDVCVFVCVCVCVRERERCLKKENGLEMDF